MRWQHRLSQMSLFFKLNLEDLPPYRTTPVSSNPTLIHKTIHGRKICNLAWKREDHVVSHDHGAGQLVWVSLSAQLGVEKFEGGGLRFLSIEQLLQSRQSLSKLEKDSTPKMRYLRIHNSIPTSCLNVSWEWRTSAMIWSYCWVLSALMLPTVSDKHTEHLNRTLTHYVDDEFLFILVIWWTQKHENKEEFLKSLAVHGNGYG